MVYHRGAVKRLIQRRHFISLLFKYSSEEKPGGYSVPETSQVGLGYFGRGSKPLLFGTIFGQAIRGELIRH